MDYRTDSRVQQPKATGWSSVVLGLVAGVACGCAVALAVQPSNLYTSTAQASTSTRIASSQFGAPSSPLIRSASTVLGNQGLQAAGAEYAVATNTNSFTLPVSVGALLLLVSSVVYKFFQPVNHALQLPGPLQAVVIPTAAAATKAIRLATRAVDSRTSVALMTVTAKKPVGIKSPVFSETCDQTGITLSRFMLEVARANPDLQELESVFSSIQTACKTIAKLVKRSAIDGMTGLQAGGGAVNVQGEEQKKLDVITNDVLKRALKFTGRMGVIASEEEDTPVEVDNTMDESYGKDVLVEESGGKYISVFDPLDGSSNVDAGIPVGTIFGIFQEDEDCKLSDEFFSDKEDMSEAMKGCLRSTLKPGTSLVSAGYALYSSATHFVFTLGAGVNGFTLDESIGEFILTHPNIKIPPRGKIYSINEANRLNWDAPMRKWIEGLASGDNPSKKAYTSRYIGSMVGDVHRTLLYGGVFGYPADTKNVNGKLRLLYEAAPMSFLIEQAGGKSTTGMVRCMDIPPSNVHQRVPLVMGGADEIDDLVAMYTSMADATLTKSQMDRLIVQ